MAWKQIHKHKKITGIPAAAQDELGGLRGFGEQHGTINQPAIRRGVKVCIWPEYFRSPFFVSMAGEPNGFLAQHDLGTIKRHLGLDGVVGKEIGQRQRLGRVWPQQHVMAAVCQSLVEQIVHQSVGNVAVSAVTSF